MASLLRREPPSPACLAALERVSSFPVPAVEVAHTWPMVRKDVPLGGGRSYRLCGGVDVSAEVADLRMRADQSLAELFQKLQGATWVGAAATFDHAFAPTILEAEALGEVEMAAPRVEQARDLIRRDRAAEALGLLDEVKIQAPSMVTARLLRVQALMLLERYAEMGEEADSLVRLAPGDARAWYWRGAAWLDMNRFAEALADEDRSISLRPSGEAYLARSMARCQLQDGKGALEDANAGLGMQAPAAMAYRIRAQARGLSGDVQGAYDDLTRSLALNPDFAYTYELRAPCAQLLGRPDQALEDYRRIRDLNPPSDNRLRVAEACVKAGRLDEALAECRQVIAVEPDFGWAWQVAGMAHQAAGRWQEALDAYESAVRYAPNLEGDVAPRAEECKAHLGR